MSHVQNSELSIAKRNFITFEFYNFRDSIFYLYSFHRGVLENNLSIETEDHYFRVLRINLRENVICRNYKIAYITLRHKLLSYR